MPKITWDTAGTRLYETGVDHGVLYLTTDEGAGTKYNEAHAWNGLTAVTESPSGAEPSPLYADNIKYLNLVSVEELGATIEAYTYPDAFAVCDGTYAVPANGALAGNLSGINIGQQPRKTFGLSYRTRVGNDEKLDTYGYKLHLLYEALAAPSEKAYATVNDSPEAITFSWTVTTTALPFGDDHPELKPTSLITIDSTKSTKTFMDALEAILYGDETEDGRLPEPEEILSLYAADAPEGP